MSESRPFGDGLCAAVRHYLHQNNKTHLGQINAEILADIAERFYAHHEAQTKARKKKGDATDEERAIYLAYPRHIAPQDAYAAIREAMGRGVAPDKLLACAKRYGLCVARWPRSFRYKEGRDTVPYPATWFRDGRWEDDEKEWMPAGMYTREDDPTDSDGTSQGRSPRPTLLEPEGWAEEFPKSVFKTWAEVPTDSRKAICDHMNKVRA